MTPDLSPLFKFSCGCIGIPLYRSSKEAHTDVWLFEACDGGDNNILGVIRAIPVGTAAVRLGEQEFEVIRRKMQQQLQAGWSMFNVVIELEMSKGHLQRFREGETQGKET